VEAMACGCPVIATDIPPFREITSGAALLVAQDDIGALASAIQALVDSPDRRRSMSACGLARSREFSWDRCARETLAVYRDALRSGALCARVGHSCGSRDRRFPTRRAPTG